MKEFKVIILKKFSEFQKNTDGQLKIRETMYEQSEKINKET